jgi:hypothetical protein
MRKGATISGAMHLGILALVLFGVDLFADRDPYPLEVTEVELVDGANFDAALSTAPIVPNQGPAELSPQSESDVQALDVKKPDVTVSAPPLPRLSKSDKPDDNKPDVSALRLPPPPTEVPTEAPRPSIAEIPSPDPLKRQAAQPESPPATEPLQALASAPSIAPSPKPVAAPEPEPVAAETPQPEPEKPEQEPEPDTLVQAQPDAPIAPAPQEARLPVAKPADLAAAAQASSAPKPVETAEKPAEEPKPDKPQQAAAEPKPDAKPAKEPKPAGGSTAAFAAALSNGEKDALRLGIKRYFVFNGNRSDRALQVTVEIQLGEDAKIIGQPQLLRASGGDPATQEALFRAGNRALMRAQNAGEFNRLPRDKYASWQIIHVTFTPEEIGFQS